MEIMPFLSTLYLLLGLLGLLMVALTIWQVRVLGGDEMRNPDGSVDSWHHQKSHYGMAVADIFVTGPTALLAFILVFVAPRWGFHLLAMLGFWMVWANVMTTATSLRFERPRITLMWIVAYPLGAVVGVALLVWLVVHLDLVFFTGPAMP